MPVTCELCNKEFKYPCFLERHLNSKKKCNVKEFKCKKCNKTFPQNWRYQLHLKRKTPCVKVYKQYTNHKIEMMNDAIYGKNITNNITNNIDNSVTNIDNSINITIQPGANFILPFGKENNSMMTKEMIEHLLKYAAMPVMYFRMLHLNPKYPENHNVILKNKKDNKMNIKTKDGWKEKSYMEFITDFINDLQHKLYLYGLMTEEEITDIKRRKFIKDKIADLDYKCQRFLEDDKILSDVKQWIRSMRIELIDAQSFLLVSKRIDRGVLEKDKPEKLKDIDEYKKKFDKKALLTGLYDPV